jgi:glycosyltransferase involved in cell wall biosynthesis
MPLISAVIQKNKDVRGVIMKKLYIHAPNVHQGGGRTLLNALLKGIECEALLFTDQRMLLPKAMGVNIKVTPIAPSIAQRILAEKRLAQVVKKEDVVLCFGNLPPLFKLRGRTVVFVQNRYLIEDVPLSEFPHKVRLRLAVERLWLARRLMNVDEFVVQTQTMKRYLVEKTRGKVPVSELPFVADPSGYTRDLPQSEVNKDVVFDFVYVASGEPHKNHRKLVEAWCLLAEDGLFPSLCLTLDEARFVELFRLIDEMQKRHGLEVTNVGELSHHEVLALYKKSGAAIYPSKFESFGLPLIESRQAGLPVLASELDFVRDVLDPNQTFNPDSPISIARAVKRFMGVDEKSLPLLDAKQFLTALFDRDVR